MSLFSFVSYTFFMRLLKTNASKFKPKLSAAQFKFWEYHQRAVLPFCEQKWPSRIFVFLGFSLKHATASTPHFIGKALGLMSVHAFLHRTQQACVYSKLRYVHQALKVKGKSVSFGTHGETSGEQIQTKTQHGIAGLCSSLCQSTREFYVVERGTRLCGVIKIQRHKCTSPVIKLEMTSQFQLAAGHLATLEESKGLYRYNDSAS